MNIAFLEIVHSYGGARISTVELAHRLSAEHHVVMIDMYGTCRPFVDACNKMGVELEIVSPASKSLILSSRNPLKRIANLSRFAASFFALRKRISQLILQHNLDYIIVNNAKALSYLAWNKTHCRTVFYAQGWFLPQQINSRNRFLYRHAVDRFLCISEATRHALYCAGVGELKQLYVVPNAISDAEIRGIAPAEVRADGVPVILFSGGFLPTKGVHIAVEVARKLKEKQFGFKMVITGLIYSTPSSRQYYERILRMIEEYDLAEEVEVVANKPNVIAYFKAADMLIHPSATEGLPRVLMEAMMLRLPVIANPVGGVTDFIQHGFTGYLSRYDNVDDYVQYVIRLATDKALYEQIADNAYQLIQNTYNPKAQLQAFVDSLA